MNALNSIRASADISLSDTEFQTLSELARKEFGLSLSASKKSLVSSRLSRRFRARGTNSFADYMTILQSEDADGERQELISALTTNVTSFFRESHHFDTLRADCIPYLKQRAEEGKRLRVWSSACSLGQEPYSIAMTLLDAWPSITSHDFRILATDIDAKVVEKARSGEYPVEEQAGISTSLQKNFIKPQKDNSQFFEMNEKVCAAITFAELNLIAQWPFSGPFDVIFCRNVAIYFDKETQQTLWTRFCENLSPGGYLFIGHSERVSGAASTRLAGIGITSYRKQLDAVSTNA